MVAIHGLEINSVLFLQWSSMSRGKKKERKIYTSFVFYFISKWIHLACICTSFYVKYVLYTLKNEESEELSFGK